MDHIKENLAQAGTPGEVGIDLFSAADRARNYSPNNTAASRSWASSTKFPRLIRALVGGGTDPIERIFKGRVAWAIRELIAAGARGCTPIDEPGPRWSDYIRKARLAGVDIETIHEAHAGPYSGHHARYVLRSPIEILEVEEAGR